MSASSIRSGNRDIAQKTPTRALSVILLAAFTGQTEKVGAMVVPGDIQHLIVLMLENRSFDCMLGRLYPSSANFAGLTGNETNPFARPDGDEALPVWSGTSMAQQIACTPNPDPGELFDDMNTQLFGSTNGRQAGPASMQGFVANYMAQKATDEPHDPAAVMHYFTPEQVPVISRLARAFGVCDQWHAPAPCQTWPNRFFAHTATALGHVNNSNFPIPFRAPSIFKRLEDCDKSWRVYFHDAPQSILLGDIWTLAPLHFRFFSQFLADAHTGALPNYSFIEPRYFADFGLGIPNDQHPPHNVAYGEQLIAAVYNAVRSSPCWKKSLLIVTYDEHGGCYDHMPPPTAVAPDNCNQEGFAFDAYGVRVPAVVISPYIPPGSVIRSAPKGLPHTGPPYPFDHTSIIATLRVLFDLGEPLTARDGVAPDLLASLSLDKPENDGPLTIVADRVSKDFGEVRRRALARPNSLQDALSKMVAALPPDPITSSELAIAQVAASAESDFENVTQAAVATVDRIKSFLGV